LHAAKLPGFGGYHPVKAGDGVMSSVGFLDTSEAGRRVDQLVSDRLREETLRRSPDRTEDQQRRIVAHKPRELV
jgi:hypothetical protein